MLFSIFHMSYFICLYRFIYIFIKWTVILLAIASLVLWSSDPKFTEFEITSSRPLSGKLALNNLLNNSERLFENKIKGPESFAVLKDELYTSLHGGYVAKIVDEEIIPVVKFGQPCENWWEEDICGRPLGLAAADKDNLIVADAYYGIHKYNVKKNETTVLVGKDAIIDGKKPRIYNSVAIAKDGTIYWTDSSTDFPLHNGVYAMLAGPSGRLVKYNPVTKTNTVLLDKLFFANGVALSPDEDFIIIAETGKGRIMRHYLKGRLKSRTDIFADGLPGLPDNIRLNGNGHYYVALNVARDDRNPSLLEYISAYPSIRKLLYLPLAVCEWSVEKINTIYPNYFTKRLGYMIGHFEMLLPFHPLRTTILELESNGKIIDSFHGNDGSVTGISDVITHKGYMFLGSPYNSYLGRIKLSKTGKKSANSDLE